MLFDVDMMDWFTESIIQLVEMGLGSFRKWMLNNCYDKQALAKLEHEKTDKNYMETTRKLFKEGKGHELRTLSSWRCKILFKYADDGITPVDVRIVDYQFTSFFHPFFDLLYFLSCSVQADALIPNYWLFLQRYDLDFL